MSTTAEVRAALVAAIAAIPGIGVVHDRERYAKTDGVFRSHYLWEGPAGPLIRGWFVRRDAQARRLEVLGGDGAVEVYDAWSIVGMIGFLDGEASEHLASDLADAVVAAVAADPTLGGAIDDTLAPGSGELGPEVGVQIRALETVMFAGALCHRARLGITTHRTLCEG